MLDAINDALAALAESLGFTLTDDALDNLTHVVAAVLLADAVTDHSMCGVRPCEWHQARYPDDSV